jgi:uncharacterized protein YdeI (YjbR/CyaY-like superfamily)
MEIGELIFFDSQQEFRRWLQKNYAKATECWVGFYKVAARKKGITYKEALDEALCFGWIDAVKKGIDAERWTNRFTPRKKSSIWSQVNIRRYCELKELGLVHPHGEKVFDTRDLRKQNLYSFEQEKVEFSPAFEKKFKANKKAWKHFQSMPPSYRRAATWLVISAKQEKTRESRLATLMAASEKGEKIKQLKRTGE